MNDKSLRKKVEVALMRSGKLKHGYTTEEADLEITCDLVNDKPWWPANGFSEEERVAMGHDLGCPGY